jgi:hypothetical protein
MNQTLTAAEYDALPWLHIHAQSHEHSHATIIGTREALIAMRDAIDRALTDKNGETEMKAMAGDGEGGVGFGACPGALTGVIAYPYRPFRSRRG